MQKSLYETLHVNDFTVVGQPLESVNLIEVNEAAVAAREYDLLMERIRATRKSEGA
jgi:hypothetical protein